MKISFVPAQAGLASILAAMLVFAVVDRADAGCGCSACVSSCQTYQTVEKTIYVPQMVPEVRTINQVVCEPEVRERVVTVCRQVPETRQVTQDYTVMVPQQRKGMQDYVVCRPVWEEVEQTYTVSIPTTEVKKGVRSVCRPVQVQEMRTITRNVCGWEDVPCDGSCGGHGIAVQKGDDGAAQKDAVQKGSGCGGTHRVWRSHCVTEEVPVTVCKSEIHEEEYEYNVTTCHSEVRKRMVRVCRYVNEKRSREVTYTVCVPEQRSRTCNVTTYRTVQEQQNQQYTVMVPRPVQKEVTVMVCHMVPQQVTCNVPVIAPAYGCVGHHHGCRCRRCCY